MARLVITSNTKGRESTFWAGRDLKEVLPKLGEVLQTLGRLYEAVEAAGVDPTTVAIAVGDGGAGAATARASRATTWSWRSPPAGRRSSGSSPARSFGSIS